MYTYCIYIFFRLYPTSREMYVTIPPPLGYDEHGVRWVRFGYIGAWGRAPAAGQARGPSAAARQGAHQFQGWGVY